MRKSLETNRLIQKTIAATVAMGMTLCSTGFAESVSKLEYTKSLVSGLGFEIEDASEAYKKDTTKEENIIYTAFQMGLLKGVSWDFENPMTEDERQVILSNAMAIYNAQHNIETPTEIDTNTDDAIQNDTAQEEPEEVNFMTEYGEVKAPSNLTPNENMWTDEEFISLIRRWDEQDIRYANVGEIWDTIPFNPSWKLDYEKKEFSIWTTKYDENDKEIYIPVDEMTNGRLFEMAKAVVYHAKLNGLESSLYNYGNGRCSFTISHPDRGSENIVLFFTYAPRERDHIYEDVPDYQVGETNLLHEWELKRLIDAVAYEEKGIDIANHEIEDVNKMFAEYQYTEQHFADFIYGVCDQIYGEDGLQMYKAIMGEYLNDMRNSALYDIDEDTSKHFETDDYNIYKYSPRVTWTYYGISEK